MVEGDVDTDGMLREHNRKVAARNAHYGPLVAGITDEQARMVVDLGKRQGESMNRIAILMRPHLDWEIPDHDVIGVGWDLYVEGLGRLGEYDADFRPRPERFVIATVDDVEVTYVTDTRRFEFTVDGTKHVLRPTHTVKYGVDADDMMTLREEVAKARGAVPSTPFP